MIEVEGLDQSMWLLIGYDDRIATYVAENDLVQFADDAMIIDELTTPMSAVSVDDIWELFDSPAVNETESIYIKISNSKVVEAHLYYHP